MRFRGKSIRRKIVALLLVPLVALTALWGFATVVTGRDALRQLSAAKVVDGMSNPVKSTARVLEHERRQTLVHLADPRAADAERAMRDSRARTDTVTARMREDIKAADARDELTSESEDRLAAMFDALAGLKKLRADVDAGMARTDALRGYDRIVDPCYGFLASIQGVQDADLSNQGQAVIQLSRARDLLSREDAVIASALVADHLDRRDIRVVSDQLATRTLLYQTNLPLLPAEERAAYEQVWKGDEARALRKAEETLAGSVPGRPEAVTGAEWNAMASQVLKDLARWDQAAADRYQDRLHPVAVGIIVRAGVAGVLGLAALLFTLFVSVRIGRGLIRDLRQLRTEAHEASGVRLPGVMRRLAAGEQVDVETEVPRLEYDKNEIGQVGQALNTLQRAAVEAAVRQAEMRRGVSEVFVNLARRSQVLLHKQLTLLDSMERRTEDTDELADLFRLDHLTTRMRRHAEGLVILSGAAPSRQWRRPVQLMDVVRASVAEVEDYERIEVRRLPRIAVVGPAVADLTHLIAELLENATVFSPPHTAVQVLGERVANGFTLEIHDRGLGMASDALLDANLRLAETPDFELSDTDRLGLFVVSRLARRQNVRVSLQPSPYGGTTAIVFIPDALLTDPAEPASGDEDQAGDEPEAARASLRATLEHGSGRRVDVLDGPVELEAPVDAPDAGTDLADFPGTLVDEDGEQGGLFRPRRPASGLSDGRRRQPDDAREPAGGAAGGPGSDQPGPLPRRQVPKLVSSHGRPVPSDRPRPKEAGPRGVPVAEEAGVQSDLPRRRRPAGPGLSARDEPSGAAPLPRRVRQASLAPQLKAGPDRRTERDPTADTDASAERDAEEVRRRMASMQRGWQRGREENAARDAGTKGTTQGPTTERDGQ